MGYQLRRAIRDALPAGLLSAGERLVLLELADIARDETREAYPGMGELSRAVDMTSQGVKKALQKLASKGLELRVSFGKDSAGRPLYAHSGRQTSYLIPQPSDVAKLVQQYPQKGETPVPPSTEKGGTAVSERGYSGIRKGVQPYRPSPHEPSKNPHLSNVREEVNAATTSPPERERKDSPGNEELKKLGATDDEVDAIVAAYPNKGPGWWRKLGANGDLVAILADTREIAAEIEAKRQAAVDAAKQHGRVTASLPERSGYIPPGIKPAKPRVRGCGACKWGYVQIDGESKPCPDCTPVHAQAA